VFCAGTRDELMRAFDADTGAELWSAKLPRAGTAPPSVYEVGGREFGRDRGERRRQDRRTHRRCLGRVCPAGEVSVG